MENVNLKVDILIEITRQANLILITLNLFLDVDRRKTTDITLGMGKSISTALHTN